MEGFSFLLTDPLFMPEAGRMAQCGGGIQVQILMTHYFSSALASAQSGPS
jgi:hypothetical protein